MDVSCCGLLEDPVRKRSETRLFAHKNPTGVHAHNMSMCMYEIEYVIVCVCT